jgi:hypothetical protein
MRRFSLASLAVLSLVGLGIGGCGGDDPLEPLADVRYMLGCGSRMGCVSSMRDINGFNNENGTTVSCTAGSGAAGATLSFSLSALDATTGRRYGLAVANVIYNETTSSVVGSSGRVTITEGANTFTGGISAGAPSTTIPCQLTNVHKGQDDVGNPQMEGDLICGSVAGDTDGLIGLEQSGVPSQRRDLHLPESATTATHFRIVLCSGLPVPG